MYNNGKVELKPTGVKNMSKYTMISEGVLWRQAVKERAELEIQKESLQIEEDNKRAQSEQEVRERRALKHIAEAQVPKLINRMTDQGKVAVFNDILFEMYKGALWLDEEFINEKEHVLREAVSDYTASRGGFQLLENAVKETKSPLLKSIYDTTIKIVHEVATRKMKEVKNGECTNEDISFKLTSDEKDKLDMSKADLSLDTVSDLVKNKVLTVIKDEQNRQRKQTELFEDLEAEAAELGTDVKEASRRVWAEPSVVEESTLFNSIQRNIHKQYITENIAINAEGEDNADDFIDSQQTDINASSEDQADGINFGSEEDSTNDPDLLDDDPIDIDMDVILAESIAQYTLMDLSYTLMLENFSTMDIRKMSREMLN